MHATRGNLLAILARTRRCVEEEISLEKLDERCEFNSEEEPCLMENCPGLPCPWHAMFMRAMVGLRDDKCRTWWVDTYMRNGRPVTVSMEALGVLEFLLITEDCGTDVILLVVLVLHHVTPGVDLETYSTCPRMIRIAKMLDEYYCTGTQRADDGSLVLNMDNLVWIRDTAHSDLQTLIAMMHIADIQRWIGVIKTGGCKFPDDVACRMEERIDAVSAGIPPPLLSAIIGLLVQFRVLNML